MAEAISNDQVIYQAGAGRRIVFSIVFILLLPFFLSLGPMLFWRLAQGHWIGTVGLMIVAVAFAIVMALLFIELLYSIRSEVTIGQKAVRLTLPAGRGVTPIFNYSTHVVPFDTIECVEVRREVYKNRVAPVMMKGARLKLKDGSFIKLGYVNEANVDPFLPYDEIGEKIAARAGVPIVDKGYVYRSARTKYLGLADDSDAAGAVEPEELGLINRKHQNFTTTLVVVLVAFVALGIASDRDRRLDASSLLTFFSAPPSPPE